MISVLSRIKRYLCGQPVLIGQGFSQEGEDILLDRIMNKEIGFYIDVGAHDPVRFSNTCLFYKKGWNGINIEPMPGSKAIFDKLRTRDLNFECAIGSESGELFYYMFNEPALNTFDTNEAAKKDGIWEGKYFIEKKIPILLLTLGDLLRGVDLPDTVDFMSIDVEGFELEVLKGNDWERCSPKFLIVEQLNKDILDIPSTEVYKFLEKFGYEFFARTLNSSFYRLK